MRHTWRAFAIVPVIASCGITADPIVGHWRASDASFDFTRDGTWLMTLNQPHAIMQGMSGHWSKTEDGRYILVTNPLPLGNTATFTALIEGNNLVIDMGGQRVRLSRGSADATQSQASTPSSPPAPPPPTAHPQAQARAFAYHLVAELNPDGLRSAEQLAVELGARLDRTYGRGTTEVIVQPDGQLRVRAVADVDPAALREVVFSQRLTIVEQMSGP